MMSYTMHQLEKHTGEVKQVDSEFQEVQIYEEENYWKTGYNMKLVRNNSKNQTLVMSHSHLDFKNGLILQPTRLDDDYIVSRSQYSFRVEPHEFRGVYCKPYTGFQRGG